MKTYIATIGEDFELSSMVSHQAFGPVLKQQLQGLGIDYSKIDPDLTPSKDSLKSQAPEIDSGIQADSVTEESVKFADKEPVTIVDATSDKDNPLTDINSRIERIEALANRIRRTMVEENEEKVWPERYDELQKCIYLYDKLGNAKKNETPSQADERLAYQAYLTHILNKAIRSMQRELGSVDEQVCNEEQATQIREQIERVQIYSPDANLVIKDVFDSYRNADNDATRFAVVQDVRALYNSYMDNNLADAAKQKEIRKLYLDLNKTYDPEVRFNISNLETENKREARGVERSATISVPLAKLGAAEEDVKALDARSLQGVLDTFNDCGAYRPAMYTRYLNLIDAYETAHPRSNIVDDYREQFRQGYYDYVSMALDPKDMSEFINLCRSANPTIPYPAVNDEAARDAIASESALSHRFSHIRQCNEILYRFEAMSGEERELMRPIVIDTIRDFNESSLRIHKKPELTAAQSEELDSIKNAIEIRDMIRHARTLDQAREMIDAVQGPERTMTDGAAKYCALMYTEKVGKFLRSAQPVENFYITAFNHGESNPEERIRYHVEKVIGPNTVIATIDGDADSGHQYVLMSEKPLGLHADRKDTKTFEAVAGTTVIKQSDEMDQMMTIYQKDGKMCLSVPETLRGYGKDYVPNVATHREYEIESITQLEGLNSVIRARDLHTRTVYDIETRQVLCAMTKYDAIISDDGTFQSKKAFDMIQENPDVRKVDDTVDLSGNRLLFSKDKEDYLTLSVYHDSKPIELGRVIEGDNSHVLIRMNDQTVDITGTELLNQMQISNGICTLVANREQDIYIGVGDAAHNINADEHIVPPGKMQVISVSAEDFVNQGYMLEQDGDVVNLYHRREQQFDFHAEKVKYSEATVREDGKVDMVIVAMEQDNSYRAYQISGLTERAFQESIERIHLESDEADTDPSRLQRAVNGYNKFMQTGVSVEDVSVVAQEGDLSGCKIKKSHGHDYLIGTEKASGVQVKIENPVIHRESGGELAVYQGDSKDGKRYRITQTAFGEYYGIDGKHHDFSWQHAGIDSSRILEGADISKTVRWDMSRGSHMNDLYGEEAALTYKHAAGQQVFSGSNMRFSEEYGIATISMPNGNIQIRYLEPGEGSHFHRSEFLNATNRILAKEEVPATAAEARDRDYVLVDYNARVAITKSGDVHKMPESYDVHGKQNFVDPSIYTDLNAVKDKGALISNGSSERTGFKDVPLLDQWQVGINSRGKPTLTFANASQGSSVDLVENNNFEIARIQVNDSGQVSALLKHYRSKWNTNNYDLFHVDLGAPTAAQVATMESATRQTIGNAEEKFKHYVSQLDDIATGKETTPTQVTTNNLVRNQFVIVKNPAENFGVMYRVVDDKGSLFIVGGGDGKHQFAYSGKDVLNGKEVYQLDITPAVRNDILANGKTTYVSNIKMPEKGRVEFWYGDHLNLSDNTAIGGRCVCAGEKLSVPVDEAAKETEKPGVSLDRD